VNAEAQSAWEFRVMKSAEYRGMSDEQLELTLKDLVKNLFHLRFQSATERLETPSELLKARREVARIKTIQRERQLVREKAAVGGGK
jgi:large subunit ribosomal protein L29